MARFSPGPLLQQVEELGDAGLRADVARRVTTARVVFADHDLLQHDFPLLADAALTAAGVAEAGLRAAREDWLLAHAGVISSAQLAGGGANTPIEAPEPARSAWRPSRYGRALVVPAHAPADGAAIGLLDLKGAGVPAGMTPSLKPHSSGLCSLREVLREILFQSLIDEIFRQAAPTFWTVPVYGVIDLGFDALTGTGEGVPAGLLVRRAHRRPPFNISLPVRGSLEERTKAEIELLLRHYGLTSSNRGTQFRFEHGPEGLLVHYVIGTVSDLTAEEQRTALGWLRGAALPLTCDGVNIQLTRDVDHAPPCRGQLVDFGQFEVRDRFDHPLVSLVHGDLLRWGAALWPDEPEFVQPSPAVRVDAARWGFGTWRSDDPDRPRRRDSEGPSMLARSLAHGFRAGQLSGDDVRAAIKQFVADGIAHWPAA